MEEYKIRLMKLGMSQMDLMRYMLKSGYEGVLSGNYISQAIMGVPGARYDKMRKGIDEALTRKEAERARIEEILANAGLKQA